MNDIPGLRLAPTRMIALAELGRRRSDSAAPEPTPAARQTAGSSSPRVFAAKRVDATERPLGGAAIEPATQTQVARSSPSHGVYHPERMEQADGAPKSEFSFGDFLDIINPLQHIPIVSMIYRAVTGDQIAAPARILGSALFGGPLGFVAGIVNAIAEEINGRDLGETVLAALMGDGEAPTVQTAAAEAGSGAGLAQETLPEPKAPPLASRAPAPALASRAPAPPGATDAILASAGAGQRLTGQAALSAFASDLRGVGRAAVRDLPPYRPPGPAAPGQAASLHQGRPPAAPLPGGAEADGPPLRLASSSAIWSPTARAAPERTARATMPGQAAPVPASLGPMAAEPAVGAVFHRVPQEAAGADARVIGAVPPGRTFAEQMLRALDKYQAMAIERMQGDKRDGRIIDHSL